METQQQDLPDDVGGGGGGMDRREFSRATLNMDVVFHPDNGRAWNGTVLDLSGSGVRAGGYLPPAADTTGEVVITLGSPPQLLAIHARGHVVRSAGGSVSLRFDELLGYDSLENLRQLVLANAFVPEVVEAEFAAHIGLNKRH